MLNDTKRHSIDIAKSEKIIKMSYSRMMIIEVISYIIWDVDLLLSESSVTANL